MSNDNKFQLKEIVESFINDYDDWNTFAFENMESEDDTLEDPTYLKYKELIDKYCEPGKKFQGLAYGGESSHSLKREKIIAI